MPILDALYSGSNPDEQQTSNPPQQPDVPDAMKNYKPIYNSSAQHTYALESDYFANKPEYWSKEGR